MVAIGYRIQPHEPIHKAVRRIAVRGLDAAVRELAGDERGVHEARKRVKETRALLALVQNGLDRERFAQDDETLRSSARLLTDAREASARVRCFDALLEEQTLDLAGHGLEQIRARLLDERERALAEAARHSALSLARQGLCTVRQRLASAELERKGWSAIKKGLRSGYAKARRAMHKAYAKPSVERFHAWRKRAKRHYYELELVGGAARSALPRQRKQLKLLAELLGDDHDLSELAAYLERHEAEREPRAVAMLNALIEARSTELRARARELGEGLFEDKPKAFARRARSELEPALALGPGIKHARGRRAPAKAAALRTTR